jgi:hypothetical protein
MNYFYTLQRFWQVFQTQKIEFPRQIFKQTQKMIFRAKFSNKHKKMIFRADLRRDLIL